MTKLFRILILGLLLWSAPASAQRTAPKPEKVHNVILMIGDGMGLGQVAAYMIENQYGPTAFDRAHYTAVCKTYSANNRVTDSGAAATAMATGHKTKNSRIGVTPDGAPAQSITELAKAKGLATGIVVTSHLADATPAGFMAHTPDRHNTSEIAAAYETSDIDVAAGGGRRFFEKQEDGQDVLAALQAKGYAYASTPEEFYATDSTPVIGLFVDKYMESAAKRGEDYLERATEHTLSLLARNRKGFFAMIEGSQIDGAGHGNNTKKLLGEMRDFDRAVNKAFDFADKNPGTLVIVTADHETGGLTVVSNDRDFTAAESGIEYKYSTTSHSGTPVILYAYGAGAYNFSGVIENTEVFRLIKALLIDQQK